MAGQLEVLDQTNTTGSTDIGFGDSGNGRDYMIQGFKPNLTTVTAISFRVAGKDGNANIGYKVWIDACDSSGNPTGAVGVGIGGATEITNAQITTGALTKYTLATVANVTAGGRYCICLAPWNTSTHAWASSYQDIRSSTANPYAPAGFTAAKRVHLDGSFANPTAPDSGNDDILFETYGYVNITSNNFYLRQGFS